MSKDPSQDICPESPSGEDTHHLTPRPDGSMRCAYCGRSRSELVAA